MSRGHRPVETVPDHGINIGACYQIVASLAHKEQEQEQQEYRREENFNFF